MNIKLILLITEVQQIFCGASINFLKRKVNDDTKDTDVKIPIKKDRDEKELLDVDISENDKENVLIDTEEDSFYKDILLVEEFSSSDDILDIEASDIISIIMQKANNELLPQDEMMIDNSQDHSLDFDKGLDINLLENEVTQNIISDYTSETSFLDCLDPPHLLDTNEMEHEELLKINIEPAKQKSFEQNGNTSVQTSNQHSKTLNSICEQSYGSENSLIDSVKINTIVSELSELDFNNTLLYSQDPFFLNTEDAGPDLLALDLILNKETEEANFLKNRSSKMSIIEDLFKNKKKITKNNVCREIGFKERLFNHLKANSLTSCSHYLYESIEVIVMKDLRILKQKEQIIANSAKADEYYEMFGKELEDYNISKLSQLFNLCNASLFDMNFVNNLITNVFLNNLKLQEYLKEFPEIIVFEKIIYTIERSKMVLVYYQLRLLIKLITEKKEITSIRRLLIKKFVEISLLESIHRYSYCFKDLPTKERFCESDSSNIMNVCEKPHLKISYILFNICPHHKRNVFIRNAKEGLFSVTSFDFNYISLILDFIMERRIMIYDWLIKNGDGVENLSPRNEFHNLKTFIKKKKHCYGCIFTRYYELISQRIYNGSNK